MEITSLLKHLDYLLWDGFLVYVLVIVGILLTIRLRGLQFRYLFYSLKLAFSRHDDKAQGDISQFQSLMTAMAATIGIGSIAGMATAIIGGGFGAIFWMWVVALLGMATKYAESILAVKYRSLDKNNKMCGGPMYYIEKGLKWKWLGVFFAIFGALAAFGGGNIIQSQSISDALFDLAQIPHIATGIILTLVTAIAIIGGIKSLGKINAVLVPVMASLYIIGGLIILIMKIKLLPAGIMLIFKSAFTKEAAIGGFTGVGVMAAVQLGIARGISSNEAGLGSAPIASAAAKTDVPGRQALISMSGVFLSSFIVCTITALVLSVTNVVGDLTASGKLLNGAPLVMKAFKEVLPGGNYIVAVGLILFGFSTILGWSYYGEKCVEYLFGEKSIFYYRAIFLCIVLVGSILSIEVVWPLADIFNGLMALPNLIGLFFLSNIVVAETKIFIDFLKEEKAQKS
jgi:alanine or glycine:cation symporter, AGCS family